MSGLNRSFLFSLVVFHIFTLFFPEKGIKFKKIVAVFGI